MLNKLYLAKVHVINKKKLKDCIQNTNAVCNPRQNSVRVQNKIQSEKNFFCPKENFVTKNWSWILSQTDSNQSELIQINAYITKQYIHTAINVRIYQM